MGIRIGIIGYGEFSKFFDSFRMSMPADVDLIVRDGIFDDALRNALELDRDDAVDVIISAGSNGRTVANSVLNPYVNINVTGVDFLLALKKAKGNNRKVAVVTYQEHLPFINLVAEMVNIDLEERIYCNETELSDVLRELSERGVRSVIGSSLVSERAREYGMRGYFIYSEDSMWSGVLHAQNIARVRQKELERTTQLKSILQFTREGIVATDQYGLITVFNDSAQRITGISKADAIGKDIKQVLQNTRMDRVIARGSPELDAIQRIGNTHILTNRVPIIVKGQVIGALATFQTVDAVRKAEQSICAKLSEKGFTAQKNIDDIIGESDSILRAKENALIYAATEAIVLIRGETGTGKEFFAQGIHMASSRCSRPFVAINCASLPENLLESELFGYEEGAFTGAKRGGKRGVFELAHTGTIFLDEIGEINASIQARLLRVIEQKEVFRLGSERITPVDVRIIAATNQDLWQRVKTGAFREDLYYRINVLELKLPPLRDRRGDIPALFTSFLSEYRPDLSKKEQERIMGHPALWRYDWPGNIRELRNIAQRIGALYTPNLTLEALFERAGIVGAWREETAGHDMELAKLLQIVQSCHGNKAAAARKLGIGRTTLWRRLRQLNSE